MNDVSNLLHTNIILQPDSPDYVSWVRQKEINNAVINKINSLQAEINELKTLINQQNV